MSGKAVASMLAQMCIPPSPKVMARRNETVTKINKRSRGYQRHVEMVSGVCESCSRDVPITYTSSVKSTARLCEACICMSQQYDALPNAPTAEGSDEDKKSGTGRFSSKTNTILILTKDKAELITSILPHNMGVQQGNNYLTVFASGGFNKADYFLKLLRSPPADPYAVIAFADSSVAANDVVLNVDPKRVVFSGPNGLKYGKNTIRAVETDHVLYYYDMFRDAKLGRKEFRRYLSDKNEGLCAKVSKDVAHVEKTILDKLQMDISQDQPMHPYGCNANMVSMLLVDEQSASSTETSDTCSEDGGDEC